MARRKGKHLIEPKLSLRISVIFFGFSLIVTALANLSTSSLWILLLLVAAIAAIVVVLKVVHPARLRQGLLIKTQALIEKHSDQLVRRRAQLVWRDAYGKWQLDKWDKEVEYFITTHITPALTQAERSILIRERPHFHGLIHDRIESVTQGRPVFPAFSGNMTPSEFEIFCADQLRQSGWNARVTRQSRDQGVDVVAEKAGVRVVLQCKLYSRPVGNKAVQEVAAGKAHEQAHCGAVVTNSRYTSAAEQLASTNGVLLLHYSDLVRLETLLR